MTLTERTEMIRSGVVLVLLAIAVFGVHRHLNSKIGDLDEHGTVALDDFKLMLAEKIPQIADNQNSYFGVALKELREITQKATLQIEQTEALMVQLDSTLQEFHSNRFTHDDGQLLIDALIENGTIDSDPTEVTSFYPE